MGVKCSWTFGCIVDQGIRGESRHPGIDIVAVAGSEVASDGWRQIVGYVAGHGLAPSNWGKKCLALRGHPAGRRSYPALPHLGLTAIGAALRTVSPMMRSAAQRSAVAVGCIRPIHFIRPILEIAKRLKRADPRYCSAANHLTRSEIQVGLRVIEEVSREHRRPQVSKRVG